MSDSPSQNGLAFKNFIALCCRERSALLTGRQAPSDLAALSVSLSRAHERAGRSLPFMSYQGATGRAAGQDGAEFGLYRGLGQPLGRDVKPRGRRLS